MIQVKNVTKKYGGYVAVQNLNFNIQKGEIIGLLGPNGAGKTTTMNMLTGFIEPTKGEIFICGNNISKKPLKAKKEIGYMPEGVPLYTDLTVKEFISYMAELKKVKGKVRKAEVNDIMEKTGLKDAENKIIAYLSRGYKQRVSLAGAIVGKPQILILDEPTVGLDPKQITEIRNLIKELSKEHTIIISSHILSEISQMCSKVIIINKGKIAKIDTPENLEKGVDNNTIIKITIEDEKNEIENVSKEIQDIQDIKLIKENTDKTKEYEITVKDKKDIRKILSTELTKKNIVIFEMKQLETTLEDAFMKIIEGGNK